MGLLDRFKLPSYIAMTPASDYPANRMARAGIVSPWAEGQLQEFVWNDIFGTDTVPVTRIEAMSLPSVVVARGLLLGALAGRPLRALRGQELLDPQPTWLYRTDTDLPPWHRMAHTLDDITSLDAATRALRNWDQYYAKGAKSEPAGVVIAES